MSRLTTRRCHSGLVVDVLDLVSLCRAPADLPELSRALRPRRESCPRRRVRVARHRGGDGVPHVFGGPPFRHPAVLDPATQQMLDQDQTSKSEDERSGADGADFERGAPSKVIRRSPLSTTETCSFGLLCEATRTGRIGASRRPSSWIWARNSPRQPRTSGHSSLAHFPALDVIVTKRLIDSSAFTARRHDRPSPAARVRSSRRTDQPRSATVRERCYAEALRGSRAARTRSRPKMNSSAGS